MFRVAKCRQHHRCDFCFQFSQKTPVYCSAGNIDMLSTEDFFYLQKRKRSITGHS